MKSSVEKLHKFFKLEIDRGYDNRAVVGGFIRMVDAWEAEARLDDVPEDLIQAVSAGLRDYAQLSPASRCEMLEGLYQRLVNETGALPIKFRPPKPLEPTPPEGTQEQEDELVFPTRRGRGPKGTLSYSPQGKDLGLNAPITVLDGIGSKYAQTLARLGLYTLRDLLYYFPRKYQDYSQMKPINRLAYGETVTVIGTIQSLSTRRTQSGLQMAEAVLSDGTASMRITWFNPFTIKRLHNGAQISVSGKTDQYLGRLVMKNPEWEYVEQENLSTGRIVPVYSVTSNITPGWLRKMIYQVVSYWAPKLDDPLPGNFVTENGLLDLPDAIMQIHFPDSSEMLRAAQQRLAFDEIFLLQLGMLDQKRNWQSREGRIFETPTEWLEQAVERLPFTLTGAQLRAVEDIRTDLASSKPMNRLLQGDVGSGKTIVAALAIAMVTRHGSQAALMAPTSILAEQHYRNLLRILASREYPALVEDPSASNGDLADELTTAWLEPEQIRLMIGATSEGEKREIREGLADGSIRLVIGTHALIEDPVSFSDLQLTIVDEQHRFGVEQRNTLRSKGTNPHLLVMTATPIPRSLALSIYGDLDLSIIDEMPPGRQDVGTYLLTPLERERAYQLISSQVKQGRQAFIIYPLVEETANSEVYSEARAAIDEHARLQKQVFPQLRLGLLHGRMRPEDKEDVMQRFRSGEFQILVSTTVVEVGVDIPNATVMLVEGANRFGLAQLHQLRGRVGRGGEKSYCLLIPDSADAIENERLQVMTSTNDGFVLAEYDLKQRGPGEFLGTRQSGFSALQLANLTNMPLIDKARRSAQALFDSDPSLQRPEHQQLSAFLERFWSGQAEVS